MKADIERFLDVPERMPMCPLCDCVIDEDVGTSLVTAFGVIGLAHAICVEDAYREEEIEEEIIEDDSEEEDEDE